MRWVILHFALKNRNAALKELRLYGADLGGMNFGPSSKFRYGFAIFQRLDGNLRFEGSR
jgi:hypothetical protein